MKSTINLGFKQNLALTPQLQQSIRLLQLSATQLEQELISLTEANPFLEFESEMSGAPLEPLPYLSNLSNNSRLSTQIIDDENDPVNQIADQDTLFKHLVSQIQLLRISNEEKAIIATLAGNLDEKGYLRLTVDELIEEVEAWIDLEDGSASAQIHRAISHLQNLDPSGIGARDLAECLQIQLKQLPTKIVETEVWANSYRIVAEYLYQLGNQQITLLKKELKLTDKAFSEAIKLIRSLRHNPVSHFESVTQTILTPDIVVKKQQNKWHAIANPAAFPKINLHTEYAKIISESSKSHVSEEISQKLQEARWFVKNIMQRNTTIFNVAKEIVTLQQNFFEYGPIAMRPLVLRDIAERLELHESTISRVTTQKYLTCPLGTFEFKYFFSSQVQTQTGGNISSTAVQALILQLIQDENPVKPLSDNVIVKLMSEKGFVVARRTIAKYRDILKIDPVHLRKQGKKSRF
jgi:RNA polymerase sigma-54 factor